MEYLSYFLIISLTLHGIYSEGFPQGSKEELPDLLQCENYCHRYQRICLSPPYVCGACRSHHKERDGECLPYNEKLGPDSDIDQLAQSKAAAAAAAADNSVKAEEIRGSVDDIPNNAQIHRIIHTPGHDQDKKVQDVYKASEDLPIVHEDSNISPSALKMDATQNGGGVVKDVQSISDVYFLAKKTEGSEPKVKEAQSQPGETNLQASEPEPAPVADSETNTKLIVFYAVVAGCSIAGLVGLVVAGVCWYRLQKNVKAASEVEYPAYGVTGPTGEKAGSPGDRKLAQSAQMYHYQHQKQQMIAMEKANGDMNKDGSDADSEEENEEGDYTVYECPGLAPTGEMEVKNPLFTEDTPVTPSAHDVEQQGQK